MKNQIPANTVERVLWKAAAADAGPAPAPDAGWRDGVMQAVRQIGPLNAAPVVVRDLDFRVWGWVTAAAAGLVLLLAGIAACGPSVEFTPGLAAMMDPLELTTIAQLWEVL
jgi:hypothetical protein